VLSARLLNAWLLPPTGSVGRRTPNGSLLERRLTLPRTAGNFVISRATPTMFLNMGHSGYGVYLFFGAMQVLSLPYIIFLLPETRNIPLEEMDRLWAQKNTWNANKIVMAELQREHDVAAEQGQSYLKPTADLEHLEKTSSSDAGDEKV
jgi:hypothetical protein